MSANPEQTTVEPCIRSRVPWDEYRALPGTSITRLKELGRSPQHYVYRLDHPKHTAPLSLGKASHTATLEPERFASEFAIWDRRTSSGKMAPRNGRWWDAFVEKNAGKTIITEDEAQIAIAIHGAVRTHEVAAKYLEAGDPEVTLQWLLEDGRPCKGRVDWLTPDPFEQTERVLVGLKTARDCRHFRFGHQAARLGYHLQWSWYEDGYRAIRTESVRSVEIVVETEPPHAVAVYAIPEDIILQGRDEYENLVRQLRECEATGHFPGPQEHEELLSLPSWVYETDDDISELGLVT